MGTNVTFPDNPLTNQAWTAENGITYVWDGVKWVLQISSDELLNYWERDSVRSKLYPRNFSDILQFSVLDIDSLGTLI